jgi:hypothetical protein
MIDEENLVCTGCLFNLDQFSKVQFSSVQFTFASGRPHYTATFHAEFVHMTARPAYHPDQDGQALGKKGHPPNGEKYRDTVGPFVAGEGVPNGAPVRICESSD